MCELFGMSSKLPTNVTFSISVFGERGGHRGPHRDGWGIAFNEGHDFRIIKEAAPASDSACLRFIEGHDFKSRIVISHIRRASDPTSPSFTNSHPFARELYGLTHVFAHNGDVRSVFADSRFAPNYYFAQGDTDSERAFCSLMDRLRAALSPDTAVDLSVKLPIIEEWALEVSKFGIFNFLLSDSRYLYAHRSTHLFYVQRECVSLVSNPMPRCVGGLTQEMWAPWRRHMKPSLMHLFLSFLKLGASAFGEPASVKWRLNRSDGLMIR